MKKKVNDKYLTKTFTIPPYLFVRFRETVIKKSQKMSTVIQDLIREWLDKQSG